MPKSILTVILILLIGACGAPEPPQARSGVIDLSGQDFTETGSVDLRGEWEFYWNRLLEPAAFRTTTPPDGREYTRLPRRWNRGWGVYSPKQGRGYATYRLRVLLGEADRPPLGLRITQIPTACRVFADGVLLHESGRVGTGPTTTKPRLADAIVPLPRARGTLEIVIQAANQHAPAGGIDEPVRIGDLESLQQSLQTSTLVSLFIASVLFLLALYQAVLFSFQRTERHYLYLSLLCLCMLLFMAGENSPVWSRILPFLGWGVVYGGMTVVTCLGAALLPVYLRRLFPLDAPRRTVTLLSAGCGFLAAVMAALPAREYAHLLPAVHLALIIAGGLSLTILARALCQRREFAGYAALGFLFLILAATLDILAVAEVLPAGVSYLPWGILAMCVLQTAGMSREFFLIQHRSRKLAFDNEKLRALLAERMQGGATSLSDTVEAKINAAVAYLGENFAEEFSREELASSLDLHPDNFSRYFRMHTGKKYSEYLTDLRVAEAVRLLTGTDRSIITIAMDVGFNSLRTFNHAFLAATGKKPSEYRR